MNQLLLWEEEEKREEVENWILCIHYDGTREVVRCGDPSVDWGDRTVWSAQFVEKGTKA